MTLNEAQEDGNGTLSEAEGNGIGGVTAMEDEEVRQGVRETVEVMGKGSSMNGEEGEGNEEDCKG